MPRLAWFTPLPPSSSGIAQYSAELLPLLTGAHEIDVFVDARPDSCRPVEGAAVSNAHDFVWKHLHAPYDLVVYQLGNAPCHDYMWAYFVRYPGLVVLHDGQLHHARARCLLQQKREDDYRSEFRFNHPDANPNVAELGIVGLLGAATYLWPMLRVVVESARRLIVHNKWLAGDIAETHPDAGIEVVEMGVPAPAVRGRGRDTIFGRYRLPADALLFTAFGKVTPEKLISPAIQALAALRDAIPDIHLLLAGETVDHYDARAEADALGVGDRVIVAGFVPDDEMDDHLTAADVCLCLRWPTSRETSASWLRALAAGRPTVVTDLAHTVDIPTLDPRSWSCLYAPQEPGTANGEQRTRQKSRTSNQEPETEDREPGTRNAEPGTRNWREAVPPDPVAVSIDILDLHHSLRLAMRRLAADARLRSALGATAQRLWRSRFTLERMASGYRAAIDRAIETPREDPAVRMRLPSHLLADGTSQTMRLLREMGVREADIAGLWKTGPAMRG